MAYSLNWLPDVLRGAGLKVAAVPGWEARGLRDMGTVYGVICHHTATRSNGNMPTLRTLVEGRSDLAGPLAQLGLGRDGTFYVVASGRCNHAGAGIWQGQRDGNGRFIGIEAENSGLAGDNWPAVQIEAYLHGVAAILRRLGRDVSWCAGHKEYAPHRKPDPSFDMDEFRRGVQAILDGQGIPLRSVPSKEPERADKESRPTLLRASAGDEVTRVQALLGIREDGFYGPVTEAAVRQFQRDHGLVPDGRVGPKTWAVIDAL